LKSEIAGQPNNLGQTGLSVAPRHLLVPGRISIEMCSDILASLIGNSRATEILKRQRSLTLPMIRRIAKEWHVPQRLLEREYAVG
jgi:hypothetical protein